MKIKNWQKILVCCVAIIFISVFFVYDCLLLNQNQTLADEIVIDDFIDEDFLEEEEKEELSEEEKEEEDNVIIEEKVPTYKNGYNCLIDAYNRIYNAKSYKSVMISKNYSSGVEQSVKCIKQRCNNIYSTENYAYTESFLGRVFYSKASTLDMKHFNYEYCEKVNSDFSYDTNNVEKKTVNSLEEIKQLIGVNSFEILVLKPTKENGKLIYFDRISNAEYYNISFSFNLKDIPQSMIDEMKLHSGAKTITYSSCVIEVQISKKTGQIKRVTTKENFQMQVYGLNISVQAVSSALISKINESFDIAL